MASVVLADPGQQHKSGLVLSLAPLMGAAAQVDSSHPKWLHVHVRPPVRGLLKLLKVGRLVMHSPHAVGVAYDVHGSIVEADCSVHELEACRRAPCI